MEMFPTWLISLMSARFLVLILMECSVETSPVPNYEEAPLDSTQSSKTNYSDSDIDYEVYAYYLPFLREQNVSNEKADYSYYENDYLSYYSYDKSLEDKKNTNHLPEGEAESDATTHDHQNATELKSLPKTADGSLTTKTGLTANELQNSSEPQKQSTMSTARETAYLTEEMYAADDSLQDVTEPYRQENNGSKFMYKGIAVTENYKDVTKPDILPQTGSLSIKRTDSTINYLQDAVEYGFRNGTKDFEDNKEFHVQNICLRPVEPGSSYSLLFPCSSFEIQPACIGIDYTIEACSEISDGNEAPRQICVKKENPPYVVACNDPFSGAFCFEGSARNKLIPCQDDEKRVCLFQKGYLEICSRVEDGKLTF